VAVRQAASLSPKADAIIEESNDERFANILPNANPFRRIQKSDSSTVNYAPLKEKHFELAVKCRVSVHLLPSGLTTMNLRVAKLAKSFGDPRFAESLGDYRY
jgi:hypothetical protein